MKKIWLGILLTITLITLGSCNKDELINNEEGTFVSDYLVAGINGVSMLDNNISTKSKLSTETVNNDVIENFKVLEEVLGSQVIKQEVLESDKAEYEYKYLIELSLFNDEKESYIYYYNEKLIELDDFDEGESLIEGIIIKDDLTYNLIGKKEFEEDEFEVSYVVSENMSNYVLIEKETEDYSEESFSYKKYSNQRLVLEFELEKEYDDGFLEYEIKQKSNGISYKYEIIERGKNGLVKAYIRNGNNSEIMYFKVITDEYGNTSYEIITKQG